MKRHAMFLDKKVEIDKSVNSPKLLCTFNLIPAGTLANFFPSPSSSSSFSFFFPLLYLPLPLQHPFPTSLHLPLLLLFILLSELTKEV